MQEVFRAIGRLSQSNTTVMITGESGTGKELVARALHRHSPRAPMPFVAINTAAIPKDLLESELFGHERGSFTGAQALRRGRFEQAEGGTLFLDEIGDMPPDLQVRLLRVLADGEYYRVGGHAPLRANVRIIAATHQNLEERVRQGLFREDLLHRLNVVRLRLPPLRERPDDIGPLARHFLQKSGRDLAVEPKTLSEDALKALMLFSFPGNVRQLENICHWLTVMAPGPAHRGGRPAAGGARKRRPRAASSRESDWRSALDRELSQALARGERNVGDRLEHEFEKTLIRRALAHTGGHRMEAAAWLGWGRNTLTRKIQELGHRAGVAQGLRGVLERLLSIGRAPGACSERSTSSSITMSGFSRSISARSSVRELTYTTRAEVLRQQRNQRDRHRVAQHDRARQARRVARVELEARELALVDAPRASRSCRPSTLPSGATSSSRMRDGMPEHLQEVAAVVVDARLVRPAACAGAIAGSLPASACCTARIISS